MSPRGHDRQFSGPIIPVGAKVLCWGFGSWWQSNSPETGTVMTAGTVPGTTRRARRFGMHLPVYSVKLDQGNIVTITGNSCIRQIDSEAMK